MTITINIYSVKKAHVTHVRRVRRARERRRGSPRAGDIFLRSSLGGARRGDVISAGITERRK